MKEFECSVIVPTYNRATLLGHTLESLARQGLPRGRFEVIVVDDGSSDGTAAVVDAYRGRLNLRYLYQEDRGYRVARARNLGIAAARGSVCVFVDSGVVAHSGLLDAHLAEHRRVDDPVAVIGYVYCFTMHDDEAAEINRAIDVDDPDGTIARLDAQRRFLDIREGFYRRYTDEFGDIPAPWLVYWTCNVSARTDQLRAVGMFDETFETWGGEDVDLGYRLHLGGARMVLSRDAAAIHCPHEKSLTHNVRSAAENYRYMAAKYGTRAMRLLAVAADRNILDINQVLLHESRAGRAALAA